MSTERDRELNRAILTKLRPQHDELVQQQEEQLRQMDKIDEETGRKNPNLIITTTWTWP